MIKFDVPNRYTGEPQFTAGIDCAESAPRSRKLRLAVLWAIANGVNLHRANLSGVRLWGTIGDRQHIKSMQIEHWSIAYTATHMQIGCENHAISDWWAFDDQRIAKMSWDALEWWRKWKPILRQIIEASPAEPTGAGEPCND